MIKAARVFKALADPTRRQILIELKASEMAVADIVQCFNMSGPAISRHLAILKAADLVSERRDGNRIIYTLIPETVSQCLGDFLGTVCPAQIALSKDIKKRREQQ